MSVRIDQAAVVAAIEHHRANPDVTLESHVRRTRLGLGLLVTSVLRVYLDLRFWILFRDACREGDESSETAQLLEHLRELVRLDRAVCPISESTFIELLKQDDDRSREATAELIDELSLGICLIPYPDRVSQELCHSLYRFSGLEDLVPLEQLVWTKLSYVLGEFHPTKTPFREADERMLQKAFFNQMWGTRLVEIVDMLGKEQLQGQDWDALAARLNEANAKHRQLRSYTHAHRIEFEGALSLFVGDIKRILRDLSDSGHQEIGSKLPRMSQKAKFKAFALSVPTLHIAASCHAAVRWNRGRKLNGNDILDFHHAQGALGYCDVFLTEKPLKTLLAQRHLGLSEVFPCTVLSSPGEALEWFERCDG